MRIPAALLGAVGLGIVAVIALIFFRQHSMIYHPRPYDGSYAQALPANGIEVPYDMPFGRQTAYYVPGRDQVPTRMWVSFCGNGSLALDWTTILRGYPHNSDGFLLIDYPGYGRNAGYATIESTRASADGALAAILNRLRIEPGRVNLCAIGHSLGAAAALDFAAHHPVQRLVLISPFTTLREEAAYVVGGPFARLLVENYDNRSNLKTVFRRNPNVEVAIFHGTEDDVIPVSMGQELKREFFAADFFPIEGADHVSVLDYARPQIIGWMSR